ncbi:MAG: hypothetical protein WBZ36_31430 [Candidatus Nitrosopolaris sp.]
MTFIVVGIIKLCNISSGKERTYSGNNDIFIEEDKILILVVYAAFMRSNSTPPVL